ncbi:hypothetical protein POSPLADRAFT_1059339 [Postia placenta MAD-698-R-SB12]|uniref:Uncharacterized protein n=1 Tax=Postia placenta MAD-698-R-SB12 TaxID=670580 RepID=A0A1X6MUZ6_9APHY|nr:hypothetical protein POSPLADRAFT_1059339 [Postia placenta MAD-698-R-SB12]OSX60056.1 hypothetical protein POSPLADRAFT_1059339 [Postia placenta MAD-698-R-SB12]
MRPRGHAHGQDAEIHAQWQRHVSSSDARAAEHIPSEVIVIITVATGFPDSRRTGKPHTAPPSERRPRTRARQQQQQQQQRCHGVCGRPAAPQIQTQRASRHSPLCVAAAAACVFRVLVLVLVPRRGRRGVRAPVRPEENRAVRATADGAAAWYARPPPQAGLDAVEVDPIPVDAATLASFSDTQLRRLRREEPARTGREARWGPGKRGGEDGVCGCEGYGNSISSLPLSPLGTENLPPWTLAGAQGELSAPRGRRDPPGQGSRPPPPPTADPYLPFPLPLSPACHRQRRGSPMYYSPAAMRDPAALGADAERRRGDQRNLGPHARRTPGQPMRGRQSYQRPDASPPSDEAARLAPCAHICIYTHTMYAMTGSKPITTAKHGAAWRLGSGVWGLGEARTLAPAPPPRMWPSA